MRLPGIPWKGKAKLPSTATVRRLSLTFGVLAAVVGIGTSSVVFAGIGGLGILMAFMWPSRRTAHALVGKPRRDLKLNAPKKDR